MKNSSKNVEKKSILLLFPGIILIQIILSVLVGLLFRVSMKDTAFLDVCHTLMGASLSVVFLGISMLNMLTDNREKIYWVNDSERLMKKRPDFIFLCRIGYVFLGLQLISYLGVVKFNLLSFYVAFAMFFVDGLVSVIWVFHISTEAFSNRKKIMRKMEKEYETESVDKKYEYYVRTIANFADALKNGDTDCAVDDLRFLIDCALQKDEKIDKRKKEFFKVLKNVNESDQLLFEPIFERVIFEKKDEVYRLAVEMLGSKEKIWLGDKVADLLLDDLECQLDKCDIKYREIKSSECKAEKKLNNCGEIDDYVALYDKLDCEAEIIYNNEKMGSSGYSFTDYFFKLKDLFICSHRVDYAKKLINILQNSRMPIFRYENPEEENGKTVMDYREYSKLTLCIYDEYGKYYDYSILSDNEKAELFSILFPIVKEYWSFFENKDIPDYFKKSLQGKIREELNRFEEEYENYEDREQDPDYEGQCEKKKDKCLKDIKRALNILFKSSEESEYEDIVEDYSYLIVKSGYMGEKVGKLLTDMRGYRSSYEFPEMMNMWGKRKSKDEKINEWLVNYAESQKNHYYELLKKRAENTTQ